jgi:preprotein translocase subunit SecE
MNKGNKSIGEFFRIIFVGTFVFGLSILLYSLNYLIEKLNNG